MSQEWTNWEVCRGSGSNLRDSSSSMSTTERRSSSCVSPPHLESRLHPFRIVGKGIHSQNHLAKLKPEIEKLCQQHQFKYYVEENEGRILVKFGQGAGQL